MNTSVFAPMFRIVPLAAVVLLFVGSGCQEIQKRTYSVDVRNDADMPVTVWLTKEGGPYEDGWKSPEDLAIEKRNANEKIAGSVIRPGESQGVGPINGKFTPHARAVLRVYIGQHNFSELLAISRGAPDRRDYELVPGQNSFRVVNKNGMMLVERTSAPMSMSTDQSR